LFTLEELEAMGRKCLEYPEETDLDIEMAQNQLLAAVKNLYYLQKFPKTKVLQKKYEELMNSSRSMIRPSEVL